MNKNQDLIQKKWLEKVQHIESALCYTHGPSVTLTDGPLYIRHKKWEGNEITRLNYADDVEYDFTMFILNHQL